MSGSCRKNLQAWTTGVSLDALRAGIVFVEIIVSLPNQAPATVSQAPAAVTRRFVEAVNSCDAEKILAHVTDNHVFVDSLGFRTSGRGALRDAWASYFKMVPDYRVTLDQVIEQGEVVVAFGMVTGTWKNGAAPSPENRWSTPAAWRAVVRAGLVAEWRVYCDNEPLRAIMRRNGAGQPVAPPS